MAVTITNVSGLSQTPTFTGGAPLDATNFGFSQNCAGVTLPPGGTCTLYVHVSSGNGRSDLEQHHDWH